MNTTPPTWLGTPTLFALPAVFRKMLDVIDDRGWGQGHYISLFGGKVCLMGALYVALGIDPGSEEVDPPEVQSAVLVMGWVGQKDVSPFRGLVQWNDAPERTVDEVKELISRSIEYAETA